ncbi:hypothetical protein NPIL_147721 [Nephila pilipes]|uniref:Uncharacterized protein n=1 Tax=Nephila pilipes TaxID=299642 RepID=A0A8X6I459_NEPPI|nr:hypothetical protein NPIL_147721 [Nephila pilipes]
MTYFITQVADRVCIANQQFRFENDDFAGHLIFTDEAAFPFSRKVNKQNVRFGRTENPEFIKQYMKDYPKVHVFSSVSRKKMFGPLFFHEQTVISHFFDYFNSLVDAKVEDDFNNLIHPLDIAPTHWLTC